MKYGLFMNRKLKGPWRVSKECNGPDGRYYVLQTPFAMLGIVHNDGCEEEGCQACCPHEEFDHYVCLDCAYEKCPGDDIDAAMDYIEGLNDG